MSAKPSVNTMVREFHEKFGVALDVRDPTPELRDLRYSLVREEVGELRDALVVAYDPVATADALGDIVYVCYGAALALGIPLDAVIREIHRSNMSKLGADGNPVHRADGKVLKGETYSPPNLAPLLRAK